MSLAHFSWLLLGFRLAVTAPAPEVYDVSVPRLWAATSTQDCGVGGPVLAS